MRRLPIRVWALAVLVILMAAQLHVWVESGPGQASGHSCRVCISLGWAIVSARPGLEVSLWALRLQAEPQQVIAKHQLSKASAPRAPPHA